VYPTPRPETPPLSLALPASPLSFSAPSVSSSVRKTCSLIHTDPSAPLISPRNPSPLCFPRVHINIIPWDLRFLCFHTLTHSLATYKTLSHLLSGISALFGKNTRGGGRPPALSRTIHYPLLTPTIHYSRSSPRTSTLPPPIYGIIPPHRGATHNPFREQGGFSD
jgi:hypothetical protein